jgi:hypothetical protein
VGIFSFYQLLSFLSDALLPLDKAGPSIFARVVFYLMLPWNLLFNIVTPPPQYCGGWLAFSFSLAYIGLLTAFVGDLATGLGCTVGLKDAVTAISLVALGTSIPDTFASKSKSPSSFFNSTTAVALYAALDVCFSYDAL